MSTFLPTLLTWLQQYGYPVLWVCICVAAIGIPLPVSLVLLAAGAFAALGDFNLVFLALVSLTASTCGDSLGYLLGRRIGTPIFDWLTHHVRFFTPQHLAQAHDYFERRGAWAVFLSRFLFSGLGGIINILAGAERYPYRHFLLFDVAGEILGTLIPLILGYIFAASWEVVGDIMGSISGFAIALLLILVLAGQLIKMLYKTHTTKKTMSSQRTSPPSGSIPPHVPLLPQQAFHHETPPPNSHLP